MPEKIWLRYSPTAEDCSVITIQLKQISVVGLAQNYSSASSSQLRLRAAIPTISHVHFVGFCRNHTGIDPVCSLFGSSLPITYSFGSEMGGTVVTRALNEIELCSATHAFREEGAEKTDFPSRR